VKAHRIGSRPLASALRHPFGLPFLIQTLQRCPQPTVDDAVAPLTTKIGMEGVFVFEEDRLSTPMVY
jgi:hypothetical protein